MFNVGPNNSATMGPMGASASELLRERPMYFDVPVPIVDLYRYLGVLIDVALSSEPHFKSMLSRGWAAFNSLLGAAYGHQLPMPVQAAAIPSRVEQSALYGLELCISVPHAELRLNRMQVGWAKALLGIRDCPQGKWFVLVAESGWAMRLGTKMLECAIMLLARIALLPSDNPSHRMATLALASYSPSWISALRLRCQHESLQSRSCSCLIVFVTWPS